MKRTHHLVRHRVHRQLQSCGAKHALAAHRAALVHILAPLPSQQVHHVALVTVGDPVSVAWEVRAHSDNKNWVKDHPSGQIGVQHGRRGLRQAVQEAMGGYSPVRLALVIFVDREAEKPSSTTSLCTLSTSLSSPQLLPQHPPEQYVIDDAGQALQAALL